MQCVQRHQRLRGRGAMIKLRSIRPSLEDLFMEAVTDLRQASSQARGGERRSAARGGEGAV